MHGKRLICLGISDDYAFMDPALVRLLETRMSRHFPLPVGPAAR